jgi:RecB family exonuclease
MIENIYTNGETKADSNDNPVPDVKGFSFSAISTFKSCPKAFEFKYIKKLPEAFNSIEAYMGTCVHEVLEWAYKERTEDQEPSLQAALERYSQQFHSGEFETIKIVKEGKTKEDYYLQGRENIAYFFSEIFPHDQSTTLFLEQRFQIPMTAAGDEVIYRGVIDRISKDPEGIIRVTDYKTGKVGHPLDTLQLPSYALYIFLHNIDQEIELCYQDLREKRTIVVPFNRKEIKKIKEALQKEMVVIRQAKPEDFIAKPSILCFWCGYNQICPAAKLGKNSNQTEGQKINSETNPNAQSNGEFEGACPQCGGELSERKGKFGSFIGCKNYPDCRYTREVGNMNANPAQNPDVEGKDICPECGSLLKKRKGRFGSFMGCSSYPQCRFTRQL